MMWVTKDEKSNHFIAIILHEKNKLQVYPLAGNILTIIWLLEYNTWNEVSKHLGANIKPTIPSKKFTEKAE